MSAEREPVLSVPGPFDIKVAIWTDGMGTYQARCLDCAWKGKWWRKQPLALRDAEGHLQHDEN